MNTKILIGLVVALVAAVGAWFYMNDGVPAGGVESTEDGFVLSASFSCADNSYFLAEFPDANSVNIIVDGTLVRTVPFANDTAGQRYEDSAYAYVFAGEEVTVTNKATGATTRCSQPSDPNLAPVNFGDAGEGAGSVQQDVRLIVSESIVGMWRSTDDAKFVREFKEGGTVQDWYDGKVVSTGTAVAFTSENALAVSFPLERDVVYIQLKMAGSQSETLNFKLNKLTPDELELTYMDRGGVLRFTYVE
jgi:hypothetical protein